MIRFAILGSGSKGNATLIEAGGTRVLIDCGFNLRETESRLQRLGVEAAALAAVLVTHEHSDHLGGVARLARRHQLPVYLTAGTRARWADPGVPRIHQFNPHASFRIGQIEVQPYPVPHDACEPCQYVLAHGGRRVGVLSDAGSVTPHMREVLSGCDALMLECNHDREMLARGPYPASLKFRVGGSRGHLANAQSAALLRDIDCSRLQHLVLTHLSETNNAPHMAMNAAFEGLQREADWVTCAHQEGGLSWREVA